MWLRDLLFVGLVGGGLVALGASLMPRDVPPRVRHFDPGETRTPDFRAAVDAVDASFRKKWDEAGVRPAAVAPELTRARRLALGLMGTVPSLQELRQLESRPQAERLDWWLAGILEDHRFGDYLAERLARTYVGTENGPFILFRRRRFVTWLGEQLMKGQPYDQIVRDLIDSDGLWTSHPATNFISVTINPEVTKEPDPVRLTGRVTRAFLGLRLDCAQCHDDRSGRPWTQGDFQGLAAFFGQVHYGFTGIYDGAGEYTLENRKTREKDTVAPKVPFLPELVPDHGTRRARLAAWVTSKDNPYFSRAIVNRVWGLMFGRPLVEPVDNLDPDGEPPAALDILAKDFVSHGHDLRRLIRLIAATAAFRLDSAPADETAEGCEKADKAWAVFPITRLRGDQVIGGMIQASAITTINGNSHIVLRLMQFGNENDFVKRYGDAGEEEFDGRGGTIPQRLLLMNGKETRERTDNNNLTTASQVNFLARDDRQLIETLYLTILTRRPTPAETAYFETVLAKPADHTSRPDRVEDIAWALLNSTEFSWNH